MPLLIKQGKSLASILGLALGVVLVFGTYLLANLCYMLDNVFDVHSFAGHHITLTIENIISISLAYLECMMAAMIAMSYCSN